MQARKITLIEIGAGALPSVTPVPVRRSSWFPIVYVSPDVPPVEGVVPNPVADGVLIEWDAVDQEGVIYIIERGPTAEGPWMEIARVVETRYLYSDGSGQEWWFKITASVRGKPGEGAIVVAKPPQTVQDILDLFAEQAQQAADMAAGFAGQAAQIASLEAALSAADYDPAVGYGSGAVVKWQGGLYYALVETLGNPPSNATYWRKIGEYDSLAEAVGAQALLIANQQTRIEQAEDELSVVAEQASAVAAALPGKASTSSVTALAGRVTQTEQGVSANSQAIQAANAAIAGKASTDAVNALQSTVQQQGGQIEATSQTLTSVRSSIVTSNNLLTNTQFFNGPGTVVQRQNPGGQAVDFGLNLSAGNTLVNENTWYAREQGRGAGTQYPFAEWQIGDAVQVVPGQRCEASVHALTHRCRFQVKLVFQNYYGVDLAIYASPWIDPNGWPGSELWNYIRAGAFGIAPDGASKALCVVVKENTAAGASPLNSYLFLVRPYLGLATATQSQFAPWVPGQSDKGLAQATQALEARTTVNENGIAQYRASWTMTLDANGRVAGIRSENNGQRSTIDFLFDKVRFVSPGSGRRMEYSDGHFLGYDENNVRRLRLGTWSS